MIFERVSRLAAILLLAAAVGACTLTQGPPVVSPTRMLSMTTAPVQGADVKFAFAPITGMPSELLQALNRAIKNHAETRHLSLVEPDDASATYIVKGYLSAVGDSRSTLLVYVWDVLDKDGKRLRRISGQEIGNGAKADPWTGITPSLISNVGRSTIDELIAWSN
jgi:hypothetical protein